VGEIIQNQRTTFCVASQQSISLSLSLSLLLASDCWSLMSDCNKFSSPKVGLSLRKQGVCHTVALPFTLIKKYLKAKEELWKLKKYFTMQKIY
jgi:hypothetical protein